jgi:hypothetical protein
MRPLRAASAPRAESANAWLPVDLHERVARERRLHRHLAVRRPIIEHLRREPRWRYAPMTAAPRAAHRHSTVLNPHTSNDLFAVGVAKLEAHLAAAVGSPGVPHGRAPTHRAAELAVLQVRKLKVLHHVLKVVIDRSRALWPRHSLRLPLWLVEDSVRLKRNRPAAASGSPRTRVKSIRE